ncbi:hypothetical protein AB838_09845 [Rhodobacteraceae bacterium (ex Bugula neritina AB1)]|nr:hypothetical protein AB838_09845 [Rhodobacteraceae bacterium (ex Bugula neritina AB1)]
MTGRKLLLLEPADRLSRQQYKQQTAATARTSGRAADSSLIGTTPALVAERRLEADSALPFRFRPHCIPPTCLSGGLNSTLIDG